MKPRRIFVLALPGVLAVGAPAIGQPAASAVLAPAVAAAQQQYATSFGAHAELYNGPEYLDYSSRYHTKSGHPFFLVPEQQPGAVSYNGHNFTDILLTYDVVLDQLVLSPPQTPLTSPLRLEGPMVDGQATLKVSKSALLDGVSHFTLFTAEQRPMCERLYFQAPKHSLAITARADKSAYTTRDRVSVQLITADQQAPLPANLSMAVYRLNSLNAAPQVAIDRYLALLADV